MFYTIYKVTNKINGKIYIGKHQTKDLNDGYMGSGKHLRYSISKYGIENFEKEILFQFDNETDMNAKEAELVTEEFCLREDTYNLCPGGNGGFGYLNSFGLSVKQFKDTEFAKRCSKKANEKKRILRDTNETWFIDYKEKLSNSIKEYHRLNDNAFKGKTHTEETKRNIGIFSSENQKGEKNSQYGTTWIWHEIFGNKKIKKEFLDEFLEKGWIKTYKPGYKKPEINV